MANAREQRVLDAVREWRKAKCVSIGVVYNRADDGCFGDNHIEECPVEIARQEILAADNALAAK